MASIGQVGSFDFRQAFIQKNVLKIILQAKVIDKDFNIETNNIWNTARPGAINLSVAECFNDKKETRVAIR